MMQITPRERWLLIGLLTAVAVWASYALALQPARHRIRTLARIIPEKQAELNELEATSVRYAALRHEFVDLRTKIAEQPADFPLLPFLESVLERHRLTRQASLEQSTAPPQPDYTEVMVTVELRDVSWKQLVDFLGDLQTPEAVLRIGSLHIRRNPGDSTLLDSTVGISSPRLAPPALTAQTVP
ncbi:MAG: type II secretion system protein M [Planctomycetes bacterium]|jgi:type II secretory pathway component PulM|nr:type II secretion system protein M [Planctomycetota bacterium]